MINVCIKSKWFSKRKNYDKKVYCVHRSDVVGFIVQLLNVRRCRKNEADQQHATFWSGRLINEFDTSDIG